MTLSFCSVILLCVSVILLIYHFLKALYIRKKTKSVFRQGNTWTLFSVSNSAKLVHAVFLNQCLCVKSGLPKKLSKPTLSKGWWGRKYNVFHLKRTGQNFPQTALTNILAMFACTLPHTTGSSKSNIFVFFPLMATGEKTCRNYDQTWSIIILKLFTLSGNENFIITSE